MAKLTIKKFPERHLCEIYQQVAIRFAFLSGPNDGYKQCHVLAKCRDFLQDAVRSEVNKGECSIYSFIYKSGVNPPVDLKKMRMLINKGPEATKEFKGAMKKAKTLLNHYEDMAGWANTSLVEIANDPNMVLFSGPSNWMRSSFLVSMYSLLIRLSYKDFPSFSSNGELIKIYKNLVDDYKNKRKSDNDLTYMNTCYNRLHLVIENTSKLFSKKMEDNYPAEIHINSFHNLGGIFSLCSFNSYNSALNNKFKKICEGKI